MSTQRAIILGASSLLAEPLLQALSRQGWQGIALRRKALKTHMPKGFSAQCAESWQWQNFINSEPVVVFSLVPLWVLAESGLRLGAQHKLLAVGSTSVLSKANSLPFERSVAQRLAKAEAEILAAAPHSTILRTSLLYDGQKDANITKICQFIRRFGFLPVAGKASGRRQPLHADDAAAALLLCAERRAPSGLLHMSGSSTISFADMASICFAALGKRPRLLHLPLGVGPVLPAALAGAWQRMNQHQDYGTSDWLLQQGWNARAFTASAITASAAPTKPAG